MILVVGIGYWLHTSEDPKCKEPSYQMGFYVGTVILMAAFGGQQWLVTSCVAVLTCFLHAFLRKRNIRNRTSNFLSRVKAGLKKNQ